MLPDDPLDANQWFDLDQSSWSMVVAPDPVGQDNSVFAILLARFKDFFTVAKPILQDAQLTPTFRRYLTGDPPPWEGAKLRNGCLIIDILDKSGYTTGTSFGGDLFTGLLYAVQQFATDGFDDGTLPIPDPNFPEEYYQPGWIGTLPQCPGIIYREEAHSGIQTSLFTGSPAKDVQHVTGGHSMPGVNELISATVNMAGDMIAMMIGVPPIGGMLDSLLKPLYTDVFLSFMAWKDPSRAQSLGFSHYRERFAAGGDNAYTISALLGLRASMWATREIFTHKFSVADGLPWLVGQNGFGHFYVGDRIGSTVRGTPPGSIYVDRVSEITLTWDRKTAPTWNITIGQRIPVDPVARAFERIQAIMGAIHDLGVI